MNRLTTPGVYLMLAIFIGGLWMVSSPFVMKAQAAGAAWSAGTINDVAVGAVLIAVSLSGVCITLALGLRDLMRAAVARPEGVPDERVA